MRISDWSSDVCSSDLLLEELLAEVGVAGHLAQGADLAPGRAHVAQQVGDAAVLGGVGVGAHEEDAPLGARGDRKSVVWGKSVSVRVDLGGRRNIKNKTHW